MIQTKTDNSNMPAKLALRRKFLDLYHAGQKPRVLDCCMGTGKIWKTLAAEKYKFDYWGLDTKPRPGRLKLDSSRVLAMPGWQADIVDIDTYGEPWKHYLMMLPNMPFGQRALTVFLTIGLVRVAGGGISELAAGCMGIPRDWPAPKSLLSQFSEIIISSCLSRCCDYGIIIKKAMEAPAGTHARYIGLRLERKERSLER